MNDKICSYTAGIIDGEGHIGAHKRENRISLKMELSVHMKYDKVPGWLHKTWGGNMQKRKDDSYRWVVYGTNALKIIKEIEQFLVEKKDQAYLFEKIYNLSQENKRINQFSPKDSLELAQKKENLYLLLKQLHN